jgi:hypothetical protein
VRAEENLLQVEMHRACLCDSSSTFDQHFQEELPLNLKSLAVITILVLGCSTAFAKPFSLGFLSYNGAEQYCDFETINVSSPFAAGTHDLETACGLLADGVMVGFTDDIARTTNAPVTGQVLVLADNTFDAEYQSYSGCQIEWVTKRKAVANWGWSLYLTCGGGGDYLGNYGYLTTTLPSASQSGAKKTSFGTAMNNVKVKH